MPALMQPMMMRRPFLAASAQQGKAPKQPVVPKTSDRSRPIASAGRPTLLALPALLLRTPAAFAEEVEKAADAVGEAGRQALTKVPPSQVPQWSQVKVPEGVKAPDGLANLFGGDVNPLLLLGAVAAIAVPALLFQALNPGSKVKTSSPGNVLKALAEEPRTQLVDVRSAQSVKAQGTPDLSATRRRLLSLPYTRVTKRDAPEEVVADWGAKLAKLSSLKEGSIIVLLDADGKSASKAAAQIPGDKFDEIFVVSGGADGWEKSGAPWKEPGRGGFNLDLSGVSQVLSKGASTLKVKGFKAPSGSEGGAEVSPTTALAGLGALLGGYVLFSQTGVFLELVGVAAAAQLVSKNFLYAEDRQRTTKALQEFVDDKVAVKDVGQDLQKISSVLLEGGEEVSDSVASKAKSAADDVSGDVKQAASKASSAAKEATGKAEAKLESASSGSSDSVANVAEKAQAKAEQGKEDAKQWIESWRGKQ